MKKRFLVIALSVLGLGLSGSAQDFSGRASTSPVSVRVGLPGRCTLGQMSIDASATAGQNLYVCGIANDWYVIGSPANGTTTQTVATGTAALGTSAISAGACATAVNVTATGALATDNAVVDFTADESGITGYGAGGLRVTKLLSSGNLAIKVCNPTAGSITPAAATLRWRVIR